MYWRIILFIMTCFSPLCGFESFQILDEHPYIVVSKPLSYTTENLSPLEAHRAFQQNHFQAIPNQAKSFGFSDEPIWLGIEIQNSCIHNLLIGLQNLSLEHVEYYVFQKNILILQGQTGASVPIVERPLQTFDLRIPLLATTEPTLYLIKIETHSPLFLPVVLGTDGALQLFILPDIITIAIFTGIFLALFLYNGILFILTREKDYLLYSLYIFFLFALMLSIREYFAPFLQTKLYLQNIIKLVSLQGSALFMMLFTLSFLNIKALYPNLYRRIFLLSTVYFMLFLAVPLAGVEMGQYLMIMTLSFVVITSLFLGIFTHLHGNTFAKYYLIASSGFLMSAIISIAMAEGFIPYTYMTYNATLFGAIWQIILFSLALGYKIKLLYREHTKAMTHIKTQNKMLFLQSRYTSVGELIRNITHQWKEPLGEIGAIQTNLKSTLIFQGSVSNEKLLNAINLSHKIISHLAETIDTFYRFFRAKTTENQEFDITNEIDNLQRMVKYTFDCEHIELTCKYSERPILLCGHPNEFAHAILNIILNAKDILIKRHVKNPRVSIEVSTTLENIIICIEDNGGGILQEPINKIFDAGISSSKDNIGIGLYIAKTIIEQKIQGHISVKNSDVGAIFTITLPHITCESKSSNASSSFMAMEESAIARISRLEKDIARRIEVEKNLQQWAHIFESAHWGIAICNVTTNTFDLINPEFARMHGFSVEELLNQPIANVFAPDHRAHLPEAFQIVHDEGHNAFESEHLRKDGSTFPVDIDIIAVKSESGELLYRIANVRDITLYKQTHERLLLKKFALNHIHDAVFLIDENADFCDVNEGACKALGYTHYELMNMNVGDIDPEWPQERWPEHWNELKKAGSMTMELRHKRKDGSIFPVEISANYIEFAGKTYNMSIVRDITERKVAQTELLLINKALNNTDEATYILLRDKITQVNDGACKMLGYSREELTSMSLYDIDPELTQKELEKIGDLGDGTNSIRFERKHRTKDGTILDVEIVTNLFEHDGTAYAFAAVRDITEQKNANETLLLQKFALDTIHEAVYLIDENSMFHYVNEGACHALGYTKEELLKLGVVHIDPTSTPEWWKAHWKDIKEQKNMLIEATHQRKDGTLFPIEVSINYFEYSGVGYNLAVTRDISERRLLEERKEDERMRLFFEKQLVGMAISSPEKSWLKVNDKLCAMFGYSQEELTHKTWSELTYPEDLEPDVKQFERVLRGEIEGFNIQKRFIRKDGGILYTNLSTTCIRNTDGRASYFLTLIEDITEQTLTHEALAQKEQELRLLADSSPGMMGSFCLRTDGSMYMPYVSPNIVDLFGLQPEDVNKDAMPLLALNHPDDVQRIHESILKSAEEMSVWHEEYRIIHPLKGERWMESNTKPERNANGDITWYGYVHDITERKQSELILDETRQRLQCVLQGIPDPVWMKDANGHFLACNHGVARLFNTKEEDIIGKDDYDFFEPELAEFYRNKDRSAVEADYVRVNEELWTFRDNGEQALMETRKVPVKNSNGALIGVIGVARDITERKKMEEKLKKSETSLNKAQNIAKIGSWELDIASDTLTWSDETYRIFELDRSQTTELHKAFYEIVHPDDREMVSRLYVESVKNKLPYEMPHRIVMRDGRIKNVLETCETQYDAEGNPVLSIGTVQDVTDRTQMESSLSETNERYLQILDHSTDVIYLIEVTPEGRFIYVDVNAAFVEVTGIPREVVMGLRVEEIEDKAFRAILIDKFTTCLNAGETTNYIANYLFPIGIRTFHSVLSPIRDENGRIVRIVGAARDISEQKQNEETIKVLNTTLEEKVKRRTLQLQQALEFSNGVINALPDLLFEIDLNGKYLNIWARDEELLAKHKELLLGQSVHEVLSHEAAHTMMEALKEANTKGVSFGNTIKVELQQGARYFEASVSKKMSNNTFLVLSRDITERKKAEVELLEREEKFSKLFKLSPAAISITSLERNMYLDVNDSFLYHTGYTYEEVVGKNSAELGIFANPEERAEFFRSVMEDGYVKDFHYTFKTKSGTIGYAMAYASLITLKGERCLIGHSYDMAERHKIQMLNEERLALEVHLSKIAEAAPGVNYIFEKTAMGEVHFTYLGPRFAALFGMHVTIALENFSFFLQQIHPDDVEKVQHSIVKIEQNMSFWHEEFRIIHPQKGIVWIEGQSFPEEQPNGSILWYGFFHDATERKTAEEALTKSEEAFHASAKNITHQTKKGPIRHA